MKISSLILSAIALVATITSCGGNSSKSKQSAQENPETAVVDTLKKVFTVILEGGKDGVLNQKDEVYVESFLIDAMKKNADDYVKSDYHPEETGYHWIGFKQSVQLTYNDYTVDVTPSAEEKGVFIVTMVMNPEMKDGEYIETNGGYSGKWKQTTKNIVRTTLCEDGVVRISSYELLSSEGNPN